MLAKGHKIRAIRDLLIHYNVKITQIYSHVVGKNQSGVLSERDVRTNIKGIISMLLKQFKQRYLIAYYQHSSLFIWQIPQPFLGKNK